MKRIIIFITTLCALSTLNAQQLKSKEGEISFFSEAPLENIDAINKEAKGVFDLSNGNIAFSVPITGFEFDKSLMQKHFNERYMESEKFPNATFTGSIENFNPSTSGEKQVIAKGEMTIHGVTKRVEIPGTIELSDGNIKMRSTFIIRLEDYDVKIPQVLWQNIAEEVEVKVAFNFDKK